MRITLVEVSKPYRCKKCGKEIKPGEKAVKTVSSSSSCSATEIYAVYYHENCWRPRGK